MRIHTDREPHGQLAIGAFDRWDPLRSHTRFLLRPEALSIAVLGGCECWRHEPSDGSSP
jgi:hypothetical protein